MRCGLSLIEILVAVAVMTLALGPMVSLLSSSNRVSNASIYEVMAVHYAAELAEQLQRFAGRFGDILADARQRSGNSSLTLDGLLMDPGFTAALETIHDETKAIPLQTSGVPLKVSLFVSPLHPLFYRRRLEARPLDTSGLTLLNAGRYWDIKITLAWRLAPSEPPDRHRAEFSVVVRE
ncbi:MAG: hypothetical protein OZSIB_2623 [Candidatus Ozemobacter sibiricus]|uniref:Prepilin-type N-terminal cleavage/methylation domain-containing protein n=1 Tax=Candidatus Ozemobacter sibiricus TaxID=2268124 RepID=A0A367Z4P8_9BACT|nr:MAG: hypothetical protein OZSIB_2623 [Candidatus Ozemobacter sibiricus]